jgi:integrase
MKNEMAKPLGMTSRGGAHQLRICIPVDLQAAYGGRKDFRVSIGRLPNAQAVDRAHLVRAEYVTKFADKRSALNATAAPSAPISTVSPGLATAIAQGVYAADLAQDETARDSDGVRAALMELADITSSSKGLLIGTPAPPEFHYMDGIPDDAAEVLAALNALQEGDAAQSLARRKLSTVLPLADAVARRMGLEVDWSTDSAKHALRLSLEQLRKARRGRVQRDLGEVTPTPPAPVTASPVASEPPAKTHTLDDAVAVWKTLKQPGLSSQKMAGYAVRLVNECLDSIPIEQFTKPQGAVVIAFLLEQCGSQKTAKNRFDSVNALLNIAADLQGWIPSNPWRGHKVAVKKARSRKDLQPETLTQLFSSSLFRSYDLPTMKGAGGSAAYWVPLLAPFTGARQSELCQLRIDDVVTVAEGLVLYIQADAGDEEEGIPSTTTKGETSKRRVPVHSHLIRLGFADYVADMKEAGEVLLFPNVRKPPEGMPMGEYYSKWWSVYRKAQGVTGRYIDFHAFRHTSRTRLTDAGVEDVLSARLLGHTVTGSTGSKVYDHSVKTLRATLEKLAYPELPQVRCYPVKAR